MTGRIVWGPLAAGQVLDRLLGRPDAGRPVDLVDHALRMDPATGVGVLAAVAGETCSALMIDDLDPDSAALIDFLEIALGADQAFQGPEGEGRRSGLPPEILDAGQGAEPDTVPDMELGLALVAEFLRWHGHLPPEALAARRGALAVAAASRLRAADARPAALRHSARPGDVVPQALRHPYAAFFAVEEQDLAWRRFDGTLGTPAPRAVFVSGDAVTVLPYDPVRDRVLVIEQFRAGPVVRGDTQPWQIEAVAGRIDPGETPEPAARREAAEEAGIALADLHFVARYYPSPGAVSEYIYSYLALADLPDGSAGIFGLVEETEDIRGHLVAFDTLMALVASGEIDNAPLILTALWLQRERPRLRAAERPPARTGD